VALLDGDVWPEQLDDERLSRLTELLGLAGGRGNGHASA